MPDRVDALTRRNHDAQARDVGRDADDGCRAGWRVDRRELRRFPGILPREVADDELVNLKAAIDDVADRAESYGFDGVAINGNDVLAVYQASLGAIARARAGDGPTRVECKPYRWHGHSEHDKAFYRTDEELAMWKSRDPIPTFTTYLRSRHVLDDEKLKAIEARVASTIDDAVEFAINSPDPDPSEAVTDLYA